MHEHRVALRDGPADEGFLRVEVEDVELVDPGRHDQQRPLQHRLGRRRVLDQLDQVVAEDHLAGRGRDVLADLEALGSDWRSFSSPLPASMSSASICMPRTRLAPFCFSGLAEQLRVGRQEIRRRERAGDLLDVEARLVARVRRRGLGLLDQSLGPARGDEIGLLEEIEEGVLAPFGVAGSACPSVGRDDRLGCSPWTRLQRRVPRGRRTGCRAASAPRGPLRIGQPVFGDLDRSVLTTSSAIVGEARLDLPLLAAASDRRQSPCRPPRRSGPMLRDSSSKSGRCVWRLGRLFGRFVHQATLPRIPLPLLMSRISDILAVEQHSITRAM